MRYYNDYDSIFSSILGGFAIFGLILAGIILACIIVIIIANWKVYKKAGKGGWECIIPFYGYWILVEIAGLNWWWFLLIISDSIVSLLDLSWLEPITSLVSLFAIFNCWYNIAKKFNKSNNTAIFAGIFPIIFALIFGFSKNEVYDVNIPVSKNGIINYPEENTSNNNYTKSTGVVEMNDTDKKNNDDVSTDSVDSNKDFLFCGNCGSKVSKDSKFCSNCGKEIK